jgi:hypothetical protein
MSEGLRNHGKYGAPGPRMHVAKGDDLIPEHQIRRPSFKEQPPDIQCSRCDFGTGSHACWRGEHQR